jgi:hypothetical protein
VKNDTNANAKFEDGDDEQEEPHAHVDLGPDRGDERSVRGRPVDQLSGLRDERDVDWDGVDWDGREYDYEGGAG